MSIESEVGKNIIDVHIGQNLRSIRARLKIDAEELASRLRIGADQLHRYEAGEERIPAIELPRIARALNVTVAEFFARGMETPSNCSPTDEGSTVEALELMRAFALIRDPLARRQLIETAQSLAVDAAIKPNA